MDAFAREGIQVNRQRGDERFAFAGFHFGDLAAMQHDAADQLHVEMAHVENAAAGLANHGEGLDQKVVERGAVRQSLFEFLCFARPVARRKAPACRARGR